MHFVLSSRIISLALTVSGEVPQEPVVSRTTGHLYERRLIEKHLQETQVANAEDGQGTCPITGEPMSRDKDLVALQGNFEPNICQNSFNNFSMSNCTVNKAVKPRSVNSSSIPGMLAMFQVPSYLISDMLFFALTCILHDFVNTTRMSGMSSCWRLLL